MALMIRSCLRIKLLPNCSSIVVASKTEYKNTTVLVDDLLCKLIMFIHPQSMEVGHLKSERVLPYRDSLLSHPGSASP